MSSENDPQLKRESDVTIHLLGMFAKILEQAAAREAELEEESRVDSLTGSKNRRAFEEDMKARMNYAHHNSFAGSLILLDLDNFKEINDTQGHPKGDEVLKSVAKVMQKSVRAYDSIYRLGGDEFAAILPDDNEDAAIEVAQRFRQAIYAIGPELGVNVGASFGIGELSILADDTEVNYEVVDRALYAAKAEKGTERLQIVPVSALQ